MIAFFVIKFAVLPIYRFQKRFVRKVVLPSFCYFDKVVKYERACKIGTNVLFLFRNMCQPIDNVLFLKTHKTGGSSIANILFRFAKSRHLTVALPKKQIFSFFWPWSFQLSFVDNLGEKRPNLLSSHAR